MSEFTHIDKKGKVNMVDVSPKSRVKRTAEAFGRIFLQPKTIELIRKNLVEKGDVLTVAKIAGITGAKQTSDLIPLCHNIAIDKVDVELTLSDQSVDIKSHAVCTDKTGIEMEALTAVSIAALTVYDMCKAVDSTMRISDITLLQKSKQNII